MEEYIQTGRTGKAFGAYGALKFKVEEQFLDDFFGLSVLFIELLGKPVPFFVEAIVSESPLIVKLEEVDNREAARELAGKPVLARREDLSEEALAEPFSLGALEGFVIFDRSLGEVGTIEEVVELPQQLMAVLYYQEREVLIPLSAQLILDIDEAGKRIDMELPEGLLDL